MDAKELSNTPKSTSVNSDVMLPFADINYNIGDAVVSKSNPNKILGICTGFRHNNSCVDIDGVCLGGRIYFMKSEFVDCEILPNNTKRIPKKNK